MAAESVGVSKAVVSRRKSGSALALLVAMAGACGGKSSNDDATSGASDAGDPGVAGDAGSGGRLDGAPTGGAGTGAAAGKSGVPGVGGAPAAGGALNATGGVVGIAGGTGATTGGRVSLPDEPILFRHGAAPLDAYRFSRTLASLLGSMPDPSLRPEPLRLTPSADPASETGPMTYHYAGLETLATSTVEGLSDEQVLSALGCAEVDEACVREIPGRFAARAWRRPLDTLEAMELQEVFDSAMSGDGIAAAREVLRVLLTSPNAYWLRQVGEPYDSIFELSGYELASVLAYGLTDAPPDDELFELAQAGELSAPSVRSEQVARLLGTSDGEAAVQRFVREWFRIRDKDQLWVSANEPELADSMYEETRLFLQELFARDQEIATLITADFTFIDSNLAALYDMDIDGDGFSRVDLGATPRRGLLHQASWLVSTASSNFPNYALRGAAPLGLLCLALPATPPGTSTPLPGEPEQDPRERYQSLVQPLVCATCHAYFDPIGFSFDVFDERGEYQTERSGKPIETAGSVPLSDGGTMSFASSVDFVEQLAENPGFANCYARQVASRWVGAAPTDEPALDYAARFQSSDGEARLVSAIQAWVESDHFVFRSQ